MAIIVPDAPVTDAVAPLLPVVRRFEAAAFRAWPAASLHYDGAWLVRLTAGHPAKRLNSINPLDPGDCDNIGPRIEAAASRFAAYARPVTVRMSPLGGAALHAYLDAAGWTTLGESLVMTLPLDTIDFDAVMSQIPLRDLARFIGAAMTVNDFEPSIRPGLTQLVSSIEPESGLFLLEDEGRPVASAICVHDGELAGLFQVASSFGQRGKGHGRRVVLSAIKWARMRGAKIAWLQVEADNDPAIGLYRSIGFHEIYRYHYRQPAAAR
ncbi:MAG: GNAT family N-acetyltransferase [Mesorhizobium sp.]